MRDFHNSAVVALPGHTCTIYNIKVVSAESYNIDVDTMLIRCRKRHIKEARQVGMFFAYNHLHLPGVKVGWEFGRMDHASVIYATKVVRALFECDKEFRLRLQKIMCKLGLHDPKYYQQLELKCKDPLFN
jgi:chromosomal replication initiator protein